MAEAFEGKRIGFILVPNFSMIAFTSAIEPFRLANYATGRDLYAWRLFSADGAAVRGSNHVAVAVDERVSAARDLDFVFVCGGNEIQTFDHRETIAAIQRLSRFGTHVGALCTGAWVLARAGLLDGHRATIHWVYHSGLVTAFPDLEVTQELFELDRTRSTCAGGLAAADLALAIVARDQGDSVAAAVSELLIQDRIREPGERQRTDPRARIGHVHPKLFAVIERMEATIDAPVGCAELAAGIGLSQRQLERLFAGALGETPTRHYMKIRLQRARQLLRHTAMPILSVAIACGFATASHFSKTYLEHFGYSPSAERKPDRRETMAIGEPRGRERRRGLVSAQDPAPEPAGGEAPIRVS